MPEPDPKSTRSPVACVLRESFVAYKRSPCSCSTSWPTSSRARSAAATSCGRTSTQSTARKSSALPATYGRPRTSSRVGPGVRRVGEREVMRVALAVADASAEVQPIADCLDAALVRLPRRTPRRVAPAAPAGVRLPLRPAQPCTLPLLAGLPSRALRRRRLRRRGFTTCGLLGSVGFNNCVWRQQQQRHPSDALRARRF